jgi:large subunit ribosomal protein L30
MATAKKTGKAAAKPAVKQPAAKPAAPAAKPAQKAAKKATKNATKTVKRTVKKKVKKAAAKPAPGMITVRQVRSEIGTNQRHREVLRGLGLRGISHTVERQDSGAVRGMIAKIPHLVRVEEAR